MRYICEIEDALHSSSFSAFLRVEFYQTFLQMSLSSHMMLQHCLKHSSRMYFSPEAIPSCMLIKNKCCLTGLSRRESVRYCRFPQPATPAPLKFRISRCWCDWSGVFLFCVHASPLFMSVPGRGKAEFGQNQLVKEEPQSRINHCVFTSGSLSIPEGHLTDRPCGKEVVVLLPASPWSFLPCNSEGWQWTK